MRDMMKAYIPQHTMPWCLCSGLPLMRPPLGNNNSGHIMDILLNIQGPNVIS